MVIKLTDGTRWSSPSRSDMLRDISRMRSAFPVVKTFDPKYIPTCLYTALNGMSKGVLQMLKNLLNGWLVEADIYLAAATAWLAWVELVQNLWLKQAAMFYNGLIQQGIAAYQSWVTQIVSSFKSNTSGQNKDEISAVLQNAAMGATMSCLPIEALLKSIEDILIRDPQRFLQALMVHVRTLTLFVKDLKLVVQWLQAKKDFYQAYVNSIDFVLKEKEKN